MNITPNDIVTTRDEIDIILAEYKSRNDEVSKGLAFRVQATVWYLGVIAALTTWIFTEAYSSQKADDIQAIIKVNNTLEIMIVLIYLSLALLHVLFQYYYLTVSNTVYIKECLNPRIQRLFGKDSKLFSWESFNTETREKSGCCVRSLIKFNVELIPYTVIVLAIIIGSNAYLSETSQSIFCITECMVPLWFIFAFVVIVVPATVLIFHVLALKKLAKLMTNRVVTKGGGERH